MIKFLILIFFIIFSTLSGVFAQAQASPILEDSVAAVSFSDGIDVYHYATLHEAVTTAAEISSTIDSPIEITLLTDIVLEEPFILPDNLHLRLVPGVSSITIRRGYNLIEYPVIWVSGDSSSLTLGKPGMEYELFIDGGYLNDPPIMAECPLVNVCGPDSKLIMYDNVTIQNSWNVADPIHTSFYQFGAGVFIRTFGDLFERRAEFIMKGGTIRGNFNDVRNVGNYANGGGVQITGFGIFTMEGGVIMDNTAQFIGGGFCVGGRGTFKKTGGIIYGRNAPVGLRNIALQGGGSPRNYGHAVWAGLWFRNDTVKENDNISFNGTPAGWGYNGEGEKWTKPYHITIYRLSAIILAALVIGIPVFLIISGRVLNRRFQKIQREYTAPQIDYERLGFTPREKEINELLLTDCTIINIASRLNLTYSGINFHIQNIYRKLDIQSRTELFVKLGTKIKEQ